MPLASHLLVRVAVTIRRMSLAGSTAATNVCLLRRQREQTRRRHRAAETGSAEPLDAQETRESCTHECTLCTTVTRESCASLCTSVPVASRRVALVAPLRCGWVQLHRLAGPLLQLPALVVSPDPPSGQLKIDSPNG